MNFPQSERRRIARAFATKRAARGPLAKGPPARTQSHFSPSPSPIKATLFANEYLPRDQVCIGQSTVNRVKNENKIYSEEYSYARLTHSSFPCSPAASRARQTPANGHLATPCAGHYPPVEPVKATWNKVSSASPGPAVCAVFRPLNMRALL